MKDAAAAKGQTQTSMDCDNDESLSTPSIGSLEPLSAENFEVRLLRIESTHQWISEIRGAIREEDPRYATIFG